MENRGLELFPFALHVPNYNTIIRLNHRCRSFSFEIMTRARVLRPVIIARCRNRLIGSINCFAQVSCEYRKLQARVRSK